MFAFALVGAAIAGSPASWSTFPIEYWVGADTAPLDDEVVMDAIDNAVRTWQTAANTEKQCSDGVDFDFEGRDENVAIGDQRNTVFIVAKGWPYEAGVPLAVDIVTNDNGAIREGDIALNAEETQFAVGGDGEKTFDIESTVAHAIGLLLGLEKSTDNGATMNPMMVGRTQGRDLDESDVDALCSLYPTMDTGGLPHSEQGDHCTRNEDCTEGFVCVVDNGDEYCAERCGGDGECGSGTTCEDPGSGAPVCVLERATTCSIVPPTSAGFAALGFVVLATRRRRLR
jgi:hypothetical protein